jgi:hypothetical protein
MFTPQNITTEEDFVQFVRFLFPLFTQSDIDKVLQYYPSTASPDSRNTVRFATNGTGYPTAVNMSPWATGQQQRANVCHQAPDVFIIRLTLIESICRNYVCLSCLLDGRGVQW